MSRDPALIEFRFPDIGEGLTEGAIVEVRVKQGDRVSPGDALAVVETDKVVTEIPSPAGGEIAEIAIREGQVVKVGQIIAVIRTKRQDGMPSGAVVEQPGPAEAVSMVGRLEAGADGMLPPSDEGIGATPASSSVSAASKPRASPLARRLAAAAGIDLARVRGTGPGGRILRKDLAPRAESAGAKKLSTLRTAIAIAMEKSQAIPAAAVHDCTVVDELLRLRRDMNDGARDKVGLLAFFVKAAVLALLDFPLLNSLFYPGKREYETFAAVNLGIAVDTDEGLVVPVIRDAAGLSVTRIQAGIAMLTEKARARTLTLEEIRGGTFTISNFGSFAGVFGNPMILPPQAAILGTGRIHEQPVVREGAIVPASVLPLSLVVDHRLIDGVYACRFLARFMELVGKPLLLVTR